MSRLSSRLTFAAMLVALGCLAVPPAQALPQKNAPGGPPDPKPGKIQSVTALPARVNMPTTVVVGVTGACEAVHVDFGDGKSAEVALPAKKTSHVYTAAGQRTVKATPGGNCTGSATAIVDVKTCTPDMADCTLAGLINNVYTDPQFGTKAIRGFIVKPINGAVLAGMNTTMLFQPLSTLKLLPYLHAMVDVEKNASANLANKSVSWTESTTDKFASCLTPGAPGTQSNSAKYDDALPTMMWWSHNRTLDAFLAKYGPDTLTTAAQQTYKLTSTQMHFGCPQGADQAPWAKNRSTLADLAKLYEGVDSGTFLKQASMRKAFWKNMITIDADGGLAPDGTSTSYTSTMLGATMGPFLLEPSYGLNEIVQREANALGLPAGTVNTFMAQVTVHGKGGSGGPSSNEIGYSDFLHVTLPFKGPMTLQPQANMAIMAKKNGPGGPTGPTVKVIVPKSFSIGWFIYDLKAPAGCPNPSMGVKATCDGIWHEERLTKFKSELFAPAVRAALASWK